MNQRVKNKIVNQYSKDFIFIKDWKSTRDIERALNFKHSNISSCCLGGLKTAYGFIWRYRKNLTNV